LKIAKLNYRIKVTQNMTLHHIVIPFKTLNQLLKNLLKIIRESIKQNYQVLFCPGWVVVSLAVKI
jgi:hypothetical protein